MVRFTAIVALAACSALPLFGRNRCETALPEEIAKFYESCNSISALSTPEERMRLAAASDTDDSLSTPRFSFVRKLLKDVESRILQNDPGMVIPGAPRSVRWLSDAIIEVKKVRTDLDRIFVEVRTRPIRGSNRGILLTSLDRQGRGDLESRASEAIGRVVEPSRPEMIEIHQWIRRGDMWYVSDVKVQMVKPVAQF